MNTSRPVDVIRSWFGLVAVTVVFCSATWLTGEYVRSVWDSAAETARVKELQERARTDNTIHRQLLQPEFDRQREALQRRVVVYRSGGLLLLVSLGSLLAWLRWFRPAPASWAGMPPRLASTLEALSWRHEAVELPTEARPKKKVKAARGARRVGTDGEADWPGFQDATAGPAPVEIRVGVSSCGIANGAVEVGTAIGAEVASMGGGASIKRVGCRGLCHAEPTVEVVENGRSTLYGGVEPLHARQLVRRHVRPRGLGRQVRQRFNDLRGRLLDDATWVPVSGRVIDAAPWLDPQARIVLENCGRVDPLSLADYRRHDGYRALEECLLRLTPAEVLDGVRAAGLRGRRGAGAPVADAWERCRSVADPTVYLLCNADEGDPASATARTLLEGDPFRVLEGLAVAAYAIGAAQGVLLVRRGERVAVERARAAVRAAEQEGLLGERILGSPFGVTLEVVENAGTSSCGDEAALIQAVEAQRRSSGAPLVLDVETVSTLPWIVRRGPDAFAAVGSERSTGTRVLTLAGKIARPGVVEVPMGTSLRQVVEDLGGGVPGGRPFKAILAGGPFGVCVPADEADRVVDERLFAAAGLVGSGGLVVLDDADCIVEVTRRLIRTVQKDTCRGCPRFQVAQASGVPHQLDAGGMLDLLERVCKGTGTPADLDMLEALARRLLDSAACSPLKAAASLVLTTLASFGDEYEAHVRERRCPAAACRSLIHYTVYDSCLGCTLCAQVCPLGAIEARPYTHHEIDHDRCTRCGLCVTACVEKAIAAV
jgi:NADH-quinone oxidoreductase subunit F